MAHHPAMFNLQNLETAKYFFLIKSQTKAMSFWSTSGDTFEHGNLHPTCYTKLILNINLRPLYEQVGGKEGVLPYMWYTGACCPNGSLFCNESLNTGHIFSKKVPTRGSITSDWSKKWVCISRKISKNMYFFCQNDPLKWVRVSRLEPHVLSNSNVSTFTAGSNVDDISRVDTDVLMEVAYSCNFLAVSDSSTCPDIGTSWCHAGIIEHFEIRGFKMTP